MSQSNNVLFNFDIGSSITGESTYDIWKKVTGKEDYSEFLEFVRTGPQGASGLSAYDLWLTIEGNEGKTLLEFINSIKGETGASTFDVWKGLGYEGDAQAFLDSLKGENGQDAKSNYDLWKELGNEGDAQAFLDSLKGEPGKSTYDIWLGIEGNENKTPQDFINDLRTKVAKYLVMQDAVNGYEYIVEMQNGSLVSYCKCVSIAVTQNPTTMNFTEGETINLEGMVVTATLQDGSTREITNYTYVEPSIGDTEIIISYVEAGETFTTALTGITYAS